MLLKLRYDEPLSNFASNINLRRYKEGRGAGAGWRLLRAGGGPRVGAAAVRGGQRFGAGRRGGRALGRAVQVHSIKPTLLELNATRLINLDRANDVSSDRWAVQVDSIKTRVESAYDFSA